MRIVHVARVARTQRMVHEEQEGASASRRMRWRSQSFSAGNAYQVQDALELAWLSAILVLLLVVLLMTIKAV